ncbi:MAG: hypothetical protein QF675_10750, partial [SAR324 cluster bacterium]|nr:hypothetical protein [SAR324 cluster bacterium]
MPGPYKEGDNLSLDLTFSEPVMADPPLIAKITLSGAYSDTLEITLDNKSGEASHMVKGGDGTVNIEVSGMKDLAGNTIDKTPVNVNRFQVDNTVPILQSATLSSSNPSNNLAMPGDNLTLSVQSNETLQSVTMKVDGKEMVVQGSGTAWQGSLVTDQTIQEGNLNLSVVLTGLAGNTSSSYTETTDSSKVVFDKTPPSGNLEKLFSEWSSNDNRTQVRLTLSASDNTSSEQSKVKGWLSKDNDNSTPSLSDNWTTFSGTSVFSDNTTFALNQTSGSRVIYTWYRDLAGNISSAATLEMLTPSVSKVTTDNISGFYNEGKSMNFVVEFDHPVNVDNASGKPRLKLETGNDNESGRYGDYISGAGSHQLTFEYRVRDGDDTSAKPGEKLRYSGNDALQLNGSRIFYQNDNASVALPDNASQYSFSENTNLYLDAIPPKGTSLHIKGGIIDNYSTSNEDV